MTPTIQAFLDTQIPRGNRNRQLYLTLCQCRDNNVDYAPVMHKSITVDLYPEREAAATLQSVYGRDARPPSEGMGGNGGLPPLQYIYRGRNENVPDYELDENGNLVHTYNPSRSEIVRHEEPTHPAAPAVPQGAYDTTDLAPLPEPIENGTVEFLRSVFDAGDLVSVAAEVYTPDGGSIPRGGGDTISREILIERLENSSDPLGLWDGSRNGGVFVRVNAMMENGESDHEVANFKHALLEWDNIPLEQQWGLIEKSEIPCACVIYSGGNSIHAWVEVNARDKQEFEERVLILHDHFKAYDPDVANKNPSRFSRLPGALRRSREDHNVGEVQSLLSLKRGARNWNEWMEFLKDADLPAGLDIMTLYDMDRANDPRAMIGVDRWMSRGNGGLIVGPSGIGKSSLTMQMAVTFALGRDLFGMPCKEPMNVLIIEAENDPSEMSEHLEGVCNGMGLSREEVRTQVAPRLNIVYDKTSAGGSFISRLERQIRKYDADLVLCDPLVSYLGGDINKMDVIAGFLRNGGINDVLERTNAMLFWIHHTGKPARGSEKNAESNMSIGDYSYIGLGSSDLTNWARAIMVIREVGNHGTDEIADEERLFELILPKRGKRAGFRDINGQQVNSKLYLKHAAGRICWELAEAPREQEEGDGPSNAQRIVEASFTVTDLEIQTRYNTFIEQGNSPALAAYNCSIDYREDYPIVRTAEIWRRLNPVNPTRGIQGRVAQLAQFLMRRDHIEAVQAIAISGGEWDATAPTISAALLTIAPQ